VAQVHYASRLPRIVARQDNLSGILLPIREVEAEKREPKSQNPRENQFSWSEKAQKSLIVVLTLVQQPALSDR
jgi:hypothetical protein